MDEGAIDLIHAVSKAANHELDVGDFSDRLLIQKGCYILHTWGYGPELDFSLYIRGPYSPKLANIYSVADCDVHGPTSIPDETIGDLAAILEKGIPYTEAYSTVLLVKKGSPEKDADYIMDRCLSIKPHLKKEVREACKSLLARITWMCVPGRCCRTRKTI